MIIFFDKLSSTNDYALKYGTELKDWTIVWSKVQTKGRGRQGRNWYSPEGGLWFSVVLKPGRPIPLLSLGFSVGAIEVIRGMGLEVYLKWPNDILIKKKKLGGVLTEYDPKTGLIVAGFGINCNVDIEDFPIVLRDNITTIRRELGYDISLQDLIQQIVAEIKPIYDDLLSGKYQKWLDAWRERSRCIGINVVVTLPDRIIKGYTIDVDERGRLLVRTDFGIEAVVAGDVKFIDDPDLYRRW